MKNKEQFNPQYHQTPDQLHFIDTVSDVEHSNKTDEQEERYYKTTPETNACKQVFEDLSDRGYKLFHLTTTYLENYEWTSRPKDINLYFRNFYNKSFAPYILQEPVTEENKYDVPVCYSFIDEHPIRSHSKGYPVLHHHSVIAVKPEFALRTHCLIGTNTVKSMSKKFMSTYMTSAIPSVVTYAAKMFRKYPEFELFGYR